MSFPSITRGATSQIILFKAYDTTSVSGAGKTGLTTASFTFAYYYRTLAVTATALTLDGTMTPGVWKTSGFVELDAVHLPGWYALGLPNAAVGTADTSPKLIVVFVPTVAAGAYVGEIHIPLQAFDFQTASVNISAAAVWDYLTTLIVTPGSIGAYILQQLGLISAGVGVIINAPLSPSTLELTLYNDTDYNTLSGVVLPTWTNADWIVYGLQTATSITLYWAITSSSEDTAAGTIVVDSATSFHLEIDHTEVFTLPLGVNVAGYKVIAVLDNAHFNEEVMLVNAALTHLNYVLYAADDLNTEPPP
jgi:hypothetical protein